MTPFYFLFPRQANSSLEALTVIVGLSHLVEHLLSSLADGTFKCYSSSSYNYCLVLFGSLLHENVSGNFKLNISKLEPLKRHPTLLPCPIMTLPSSIMTTQGYLNRPLFSPSTFHFQSKARCSSGNRF